MARRSKMNRKKSRRLFSKTARGTHKKNHQVKSMRGGIRF